MRNTKLGMSFPRFKFPLFSNTYLNFFFRLTQLCISFNIPDLTFLELVDKNTFEQFYIFSVSQ